MKGMSLKLPADLRAWVAAEARRSQASHSEVIRRSLERVRKKPAAKRVLSCADLAGDLVGSIAGARDLSTNKRYLKEAVARVSRVTRHLERAGRVIAPTHADWTRAGTLQGRFWDDHRSRG